MNGTKCPKCGSEQILNDQCLKCGIIVSRYRASSPRPMKLVAVRAYNVNFGYWFFFSGTEESMNENEKEVDGLVGSISFKMSVI